ncbi:response regulator transcription factor [Treponema parvum]|uniref:Response regulator transcription factor n=1 Tax=Treponema parvum TaxID=138851 RepID=A0A975IBF2_9SPIR|nr:response regulator transcription factor [Treponema parvum]QTQ10830.1 response regulator transcription factor [Treponema parvum]
MIPNIILCDDHALLRNGIKNWIETHSKYKVTHEAGTWAECEKIVKTFRSSNLPGNYIAVVDISFKAEYTTAAHEENCGFEIIRRFTALGVPCIAYSSHDSGGFVEHATSCAVGAKGFVSKNADEEILLAAIYAVSNGKTYIQAELVTGLLEVNHITQTFTKKEKLLSDALTIHNSNAEVAAALGITEKTVVNYLTILYDKAGVKNKLEFLEKMGRLN